MKKILITGGAVHAPLDAVKIITNGFRGKFMWDFAVTLQNLNPDVHVVFLTTKNNSYPAPRQEISPNEQYIEYDKTLDFYRESNDSLLYLPEIINHDGFDDYKNQVLSLSPECHAVILGAAVCNIIPENPWKDKFPSHLYKVGDKINIPFIIAPRVIDEVKKVAPKTTLIGCKLLSGVPHQDLINAAYGVLLESGATAIVANDAKSLRDKYIVTKEKAEHHCIAKMPLEGTPSGKMWTKFVSDLLSDEYYKTEVNPAGVASIKTVIKIEQLCNKFSSKFKENEHGFMFGTIAIRDGNGFVTTARGKKELKDFTYVSNVDHSSRTIYSEPQKATLNAPLLDMLFNYFQIKHYIPEVIVHYHELKTGYPILPYAPPGTVRDSVRRMPALNYENRNGIEIENHGVYRIFKTFEDAMKATV